jgi:hypothetical protein
MVQQYVDLMSGDTGRETHSQYWWNALPNKQSRHANRSNFTIFIDASAAISIPATAIETWSFTETRLVYFPSGLVTTVVLLQEEDDDDEDEEEENRSNFTIFIDASSAISIPAEQQHLLF